MSMQTILNVDDNAANLYLKSRALRQAGFQVIEASTGRDAIALAESRKPDLVLLDIKLPDMSGLDVCRLLKEKPHTESIPVVHISATFVDEATKSSSQNAGAEVYLAEPVGPHELASTVRTVMRLRRAERSAAEERERMRLATERAGIATWDMAVHSNSRSNRAATWSPQFFQMLGYREGEVTPSIENWFARVRPDERAALSGGLEAALSGRAPLALEHWVVRPGEGEHCIAVFGNLHHTDSGVPDRLLGVAMDVTERRRTEAQREALLEQARTAQAEAEDAARMKDEFLAILSHELRTPMSAVLGWLHLARSGQLSQEQIDKALATVERNARLQTQLVNDLLDVSRIVTGKLEREPGRAALDKVIASAIESTRPLAAARGVRIEVEVAPGRWSVQGSANRLEQIVSNLLSNAIKFSEEKGRVEVTLARLGERAHLRVRDHGEGLAPAVMPRVFDLFRQADSSSRRRHGGLGLGLAIVKSLVEVHGGSVKAESDGPGRGSTFSVTLPLSAEEAEPPKTAERRAERLEGLRVLVIDDEPDHLEMTSHMLRLQGANVLTASGPEEALRHVRAGRPDVMVLDIAMPGTDGYELLRLLREETGADAATLPAIALTGYASANDAARAHAAGFQRHLAKPYELAELRRQLAELASGQTAARNERE